MITVTDKRLVNDVNYLRNKIVYCNLELEYLKKHFSFSRLFEIYSEEFSCYTKFHFIIDPFELYLSSPTCYIKSLERLAILISVLKNNDIKIYIHLGKDIYNNYSKYFDKPNNAFKIVRHDNDYDLSFKDGIYKMTYKVRYNKKEKMQTVDLSTDTIVSDK